MPLTPRPSRVAVAAVVGALLFGGGCSSVVAGVPAADPAPQPTEGPGSDPVAWVDRVCGAVLTYTTPALSAPDFAGRLDLPTIKQRLSDYLGSTVTGLEQSQTQLGAVGRSPVSGGDETVTTISDGLKKLDGDVGAAKAKVDAANPNDIASFQGALSEAEKSLNEVTAPDAIGNLKASPRLDKAAGQAANCQKLQSLAPPG
ncbi:MAG: hypothetical protein JWP64_3860 [Pseudonocardia sp.]|uniref:hypothetical protein n=1 Tax=Pseudonocardia sp. TaxID=60912 RepID=UPI00260C82D0|nr:hypothetical protein [Pseudonocardia sp.]MCU1628911.1 hypothetical protein [Pseudonocardia sp.]HEV7470600.1 hypothetical protein [Pseudonocardia sp.]